MIEILSEIGYIVKSAVQEFLDTEFQTARNIMKIGADGTPTSKIDIVAEDQVFKYVKERDLPLNILSEEYGFLDRNYEDTLILDPIDGSFNAEMNIPFYSISMAVGRRDLMDIRYAVVMNLISGKRYWAEKGKGAFFEDRKINVKQSHDEILSVISMGRNVPDSVWEIVKNSRRIRSMGCASLEMSMVADGSADIFIYYYSRSEVLRVIDIAASTLIVREAGGEVYDIKEMTPLNMKFDLSLRKNVVAGDPIFIKDIWRLLK